MTNSASTHDTFADQVPQIGSKVVQRHSIDFTNSNRLIKKYTQLCQWLQNKLLTYS